MPPPPLIGLTGAIASGKSAALGILERLGADVLSTDQVAHEVLDAPEVRQKLAERWGGEVLSDGHVDRQRVGAIVFGHPDELAWLESVVHPAVGTRVMEWRGSLDPGLEVAVIEVPLLFESGMEPLFDATLVISAPAQSRAAWAGERGTESVAEREKRQMSADEKAQRATFVVANRGTLEDFEQALREIWPALAAAGGE